MASTVFWTFAKSMFKSGTSSIEIPDFSSPQIKYIFELPFEFRIGVAFLGTWVGAAAFDHITDIIERKYMWFLFVFVCIIIGYILKQYVGIGPSSEDFVALFDEDRDGLSEVMSKHWKPITSNEILKQAFGKQVAIQWVSAEHGNLYLSDEKKPYFTFEKKIEGASRFILTAAPSEEGIDTVAFFSECRRLYITNTVLGYMKVEAPRLSSWERYQLDFINDRKKGNIFQIRSVSRGRHIMHLKEGNVHKGFHDKYGEVAYFRMFYFDAMEDFVSSINLPQLEAVKKDNGSASSLKRSTDDISAASSSAEKSNSKSKESPPSGWHIIAKEDKIPDTSPVVILMDGEGYVNADASGIIQFTKSVDDATKFQICQIPNATALAFFSRKHGKYLSLGGLFVSKLLVAGSKFDNWEKFKIYYEKDQPTKCSFKVLKTWPPPTIMRYHLLDNKQDKAKALFTLLYNENQSI